ncbi:MAG: DUF1570 domain-containing protein [Pirellulales bacterium]|nr:DUF1570 domain-containing protein [Pirellulales bacterium]
MMQAVVDGKTIEGQPLIWNSRQMLLLGRDGALHEFDPADAKDAKKLGRHFVPSSIAEMVAQLRSEFDSNFDVTPTAHFVVVHPRGQWRSWAERLEMLYGSFTHYMSVRGFKLREPAVPLVAVVFRNQSDYFKHAAANDVQLQAGTLGHYDPASNRAFLFDVGEAGGGAGWAENAETVIHEATHQTAYNVGVHRRLTEQPRWAVEGLAMMFEARGVWDASAVRQPAERINYGRLYDFRQNYDQRRADWLTRLVASDAPFKTDALSAYAEAWTLTFYLCEARPQEYSAYLARVAAREAFTKYSSVERMQDFTSAFGEDVELLMAQVERFVEELP